MTKYWCGIALLLAGWMLPWSVSAETIGISPPEITVQVFSGTTREEHVNLGRETRNGDMTFSVQMTDEHGILVPGSTTHTIPSGEQSKDYFFTIDGTNIANGSYEALLSFLYAPTIADDGTPLSGAMVEYIFNARVRVEVLDRPDASIPLSIESFPTLLKKVRVENISVLQTLTDSGRDIQMEWSVKNSEKNPLNDVVSRVRITKGDIMVFDDQSVQSSTIPAEGSVKETRTYALPGIYASGIYTVHVWVEDREITQTFWVIQPRLWKCIGAIAIGAMVVLFFIALRRKRS